MTEARVAGWPYQAYLLGIATLPIAGLVAVNFTTIQKANAVVGALFIPMLAAALLMLNGPSRWIGGANRNSLLTNAVLIAALAFFFYAGGLEVYGELFAKSD
jgi:hypothetical protein